jgi:UDPglucose 6-dehydrogenase
MKIGFVGTGKLGLPVSLIYASKGHSLYCYDTNPALYDSSRPITSHLFEEERDPDNNGSLQEWVKDKTLDIRFTNLVEITSTCDIVFVAVQTPHNARYEGSTRIPEERVDFDYTYLKSALQEVSSACTHDVTVVIISTVLPGTVRREILPLLSSHVKLCYNPYFIAMGTVAYDCIHPEFILLGNHDEGAKEKVIEFYKNICDAPVF